MEPLTQAELDRWCGRIRKLHDEPPAIMPYADSIYILKHGKKAYRAMKAAVDSTAGADSAPPSPQV